MKRFSVAAADAYFTGVFGLERVDMSQRKTVVVKTPMAEQLAKLDAELDELERKLSDAAAAVPGTVKYDTGAVRSSDAEKYRYDLISHVGTRRLAETYAEGAAKYSDRNWEKGFPCSSVLNHAERHINLWKSGDTSEDHLAHAAWNLFALMHFEELRPDLVDLPTRPEFKVRGDSA